MTPPFFLFDDVDLLSHLFSLSPTEVVRNFACVSKASRDTATVLLKRTIRPPRSDRLCVWDLSFQRFSADRMSKVVGHLSGSLFLTEVRLSSSFLNNDAAITLAHFLSRDTRLRVLDLSYNNIGAPGVLFLVDALSKNETLHQFNVKANPVELSGELELAQLPYRSSSLRSVYLDFNCQFSFDLFCDFLAANRSIRKLNVSNALFDQVSPRRLFDVERDRSLLSNISVSRFNFDEEDASLVIALLRSASTVQFIDVANSTFHEASKAITCELLRECMRKVHSVSFLKCGLCTVHASRMLRDGPGEGGGDAGRTRFLDLSGNCLMTQANLQVAYDLGRVGTKAIDLSDNMFLFSDLGMKVFCFGVSLNERLESLSLCNTGIKSKHLQNVACALRTNRVLRSLDLTYNPLCDMYGFRNTQCETYTNVGIMNLCSGLAENGSITRISLSGCRMKDDCIRTLCDAITRNTNILWWNISCNFFSDHSELELAIERGGAHLKHVALDGSPVSMNQRRRPGCGIYRAPQ
jgi:hypothetical protein